jgi:hypothetical protein
MGLFGLGSKRKPHAQPTAERRTSAIDAPKSTASFSSVKAAARGGYFAPVRPAHLGAPMAPRPAHQAEVEVEVSELSLDDEEFSSTFGGQVSQFADTAPGRVDTLEDPWTSRLRLD